MLEFEPAMSAASEPSTRSHWYVYPGLVSPLASVMPVVAAVSVRPTRAVPVMVGAPCAGVLTVAVELLRTAGTPDMPVVKEATSLPDKSWRATASLPAVGSV